MKRLLAFLVAFILIPIFVTCKNSIESGAQTIYFSSFESYLDLQGWKGIRIEDLKDDPAPLGGKKSLFISTGCTDNRSLKFDAPGEDLEISISCWGKNLAIGGGVEFLIGDNTPWNRVDYISVLDTIWTSYTIDNVINWPADSTLTIEMKAGGIVPSAMLIDKFLIVKK